MEARGQESPSIASLLYLHICIFTFLLNYVYVRVCVCIYVSVWVREYSVHGVREGVGFLEAGVTDGCESPVVGARN